MPRIDNKTFYSSAIEKFGVSAKGLNWYSKKYQEIRFEIILDMLPDDLSPYKVVDAGCGFGDFYFYAQKMEKTFGEYIGIDLHTDMYSIASKRTGCEIILADICRDEIVKADFYICSGGMNILSEFESHLFIHKCYEASRYGFIFNILHGDKDSETYNYMTLKSIKSIASKLQVDRFQIKTDYIKNDITVGFFKT
ncbi:MAG: class I SAM-dependent methyltransferase [Epsilonproteobacteria bacterium]|nr:class I SAM-dependent methyltransferase [Campylobacterota bacterium]